MNKRILSVLLVLVMLMSLFPSSVLAVGDRNEQARIMSDDVIAAAPADKGEPLSADAEIGDEPEDGDDTYEVDEDTDPEVVTISAKAGGTIIEVSGDLPKEAELIVTAFDASETAQLIEMIESGKDTFIGQAIAMDVSVYVDGAEYQPEGKTLQLSFISDSFTRNTQIWHLEQLPPTRGTKGIKSAPAMPRYNIDNVEAALVGNALTADVSHFSVWVVGETADVYNFYLSEGGEIYATQKVVAGDTLFEPDIPTTSGSDRFDGWNIDGQPIAFNSAGEYTVTSVSGTTVNVYASYGDYNYVTVRDQDGNVFSRIAVKAGETLAESDIPAYTPKLSTQNIAGWSTVNNGDNTGNPANKVTFPLSLNKNTVLYPIIETGYWIHFDANRSHVSGMANINVSYTPPVFVKQGQTAAAPAANPVADIAAYTFKGWYTDPECTARYEWGHMLTEDITLYANWNVGKAQFKVVIWQQKVTDDKNAAGDARGWDYLTSYTGSETIGATVTYGSTLRYNNNSQIVIGNSGSRIDGLSYTGFTRDHYDASITVAADGSSALNVYYRRNLMTINFIWSGNNDNYYYTETTSNSNTTQYGLVNGEYVQLTRRGNNNYYWTYGSGTRYEGTRYTRTSVWRSITGLYGATFEQSKPKTDTATDKASKWYNDYVSSMANGGYVEGYPDGTFGGDKMITRAEFVTILVRFFGLANADCIFTDVSRSHWAYKYIATATAYGWLLGYEDGTFRPDQAITRAEAVTVINRMLNRGVDETSNISGAKTFPDTMDPKKWYYYEVIEAANDHEYTGHRPNEQWYSIGRGAQQAG